MSNDRRPDPGALPQARQSIPVKTLWFNRPRDVPGKSVASSVTAETQENKSRWKIDYRPWLRCFVVTYVPPGDGKRQIRHIHEDGVDWEPLEL